MLPTVLAKGGGITEGGWALRWHDGRGVGVESRVRFAGAGRGGLAVYPLGVVWRQDVSKCVWVCVTVRTCDGKSDVCPLALSRSLWILTAPRHDQEDGVFEGIPQRPLLVEQGRRTARDEVLSARGQCATLKGGGSFTLKKHETRSGRLLGCRVR